MKPRATRGGRWWGSAWALLAAVSLLVATLSAGHRYFTCGKMGQSAFSACCPHDGPAGEPSIDGDACCHARKFAATAPGFAPAPRGVMAAPLVAVTAVPSLPAAAARVQRGAELRWARAGPYVAPNDHRIRLRVSLT